MSVEGIIRTFHYSNDTDVMNNYISAHAYNPTTCKYRLLWAKKLKLYISNELNIPYNTITLYTLINKKLYIFEEDDKTIDHAVTKRYFTIDRTRNIKSARLKTSPIT